MKEIEYEFWVRYKANPPYAGSHHAGLRPGVHGKFKTMADAQVAAEKCKKYFTEENVLVKKMNDKGKLEETVKTTIHDNVIVWIEEYQTDADGKWVLKKKDKAAA